LQNAHFREAAKQLLGDTSDEAARVYAVRQAGAITGIAQKMWSEQDQGGRKVGAIVKNREQGVGGWAQMGAIRLLK